MTATEREEAAAVRQREAPQPGRLLGRVLVGSWLIIATALLINGASYYFGDRVQRAYSPEHVLYAPTGRVGHVLGYVGALSIVVGVAMYVVRKRWSRLERVGRLSSWLQVHIFLCTMGPFLVLLHTSFKFGGLAAISFWSMVGAVVSGIIGRYIYVRIPKTLNGRFHSLAAVETQLADVTSALREHGIAEIAHAPGARQAAPLSPWSAARAALAADLHRRAHMRELRRTLSARVHDAEERRRVLRLAGERDRIAQQLALLAPFQRLFRYWHVLHLPVAILMFVTLAIHVAVAFMFGYAWPF